MSFELFPPKQPTEKFPVSVDFTNIMSSGDSLSTISVTAIVPNSSRADVTSEIVASTDVNGDIGSATVQSGESGVRYQLSYVATTSQGKIYEEEVFMDVVEE